MSNYTQSTFFTPKDALSPGDPLKIIKGSDVDPELAAISTAVATKLDTAGAGIGITGTTVRLDYSGLTDVAPVGADEFAFGDVSDSDNAKRVTLTALAGVLAGTVTTSGITDTTGVLGVDIINLTEQAGLDGVADFLVMYDASLTGLRRVSIDDLVAAAGGSVPSSRILTAGDGLVGGGDLSADRTFDVSMLGLEDLIDPGADRIAFWDDSAGKFDWLSLTGLTIAGTAMTVDAATTASSGKGEIATQAEVDAGTDTTRWVTPETLAASSGSNAAYRCVDTAGFDFRSTTVFTTISDGVTPAWSWSLIAGEVYHLEWWIYWSSTTADVEMQLDYTANHFSVGYTLNGDPTGTYTPALIAESAFNADMALPGFTASNDNITQGFITIEPSVNGVVALQVKQTLTSANESVVDMGSFARLVRVT